MFSDLRARGGTLTIREFWRRTPKLPRTALILAVIAGILNAGSYVGLTIESASSGLTGIHAVILILGVTQLVRAGYERMLTGWRRGVRVDADPLPKWLIWSTVGAMLYMVGLIVGVAVAWGEGSAQIRDGREVWVVGNRVVRTLPPGSVDATGACSGRGRLQLRCPASLCNPVTRFRTTGRNTWPRGPATLAHTAGRPSQP